MKRALFFFFLHFTVTAFAGGHEGNGGHVCWDKVLGRSWSLEELRHPIRNEDQRPKLELPGSQAFERVQLDLNQPLIQAIMSKYLALATEQPRLSALLLDALATFNDTYVRRRKILRGQRGAGSVGVLACPPPMEVRPVVLTFYNGGVVFLEKTWAELSPTTQQIILIHETLRVLQMLHPVIADLRNDELEHLAVEIYRKTSGRQHSRASLTEELLQAPWFPPTGGVSYEEALRKNDLRGALRAKINSGLSRGKSIGEVLGEVRRDETFSVMQERELRNQLR